MSDMDDAKKLVSPLGILGPRGEHPFKLTKEQLLPLAGLLDEEMHRLASRYLRSGATIFPLMGYTEDVIGHRFGVSGGLAIASDGFYYWRRDAAEYIEHYGIGIPDNLIDHMRQANWEAVPLNTQQVTDIDTYLNGRLSEM